HRGNRSVYGRTLPGLVFEKPEAFGRYKKGPYGSIRIVNTEVAVFAVELDQAIRPPQFKDVFPCPCIAQPLRKMKIPLPRNRAEFMPVFLKVVLQKIVGA